MKYDIKIDDYIGWGNSSADAVIPKVEALEGQPCHVYVSSFGGYTTDGLRIYQAFKEHGNVTVHIFGMSASAATILAMGAKTIKMSKNALFLIHRTSLGQDIWGSYNSEDIDGAIKKLLNDKATLDKLDNIIAAIYAERAKGETDKFIEEMKKEEWLTADEALNFGLVDEIMEEGDATLMTDDLERRIVACGYPMPHLDHAPAAPNFMDRLRSGLVALGLLPEKTEHSTITPAAAAAPLTNKTVMNTNYTNVMAALNVEALSATEEGAVTLTAEQLTALETTMANAQAQAAAAQETIAARDTEINALHEQVNNLLNADGAEDEAATAPAEEQPSALDEMCDLLRDI